jgi:hypothetical protein
MSGVVMSVLELGWRQRETTARTTVLRDVTAQGTVLMTYSSTLALAGGTSSVLRGKCMKAPLPNEKCDG